MASFQTFATPAPERTAPNIIASIDNLLQHTSGTLAVFDQWAQEKEGNIESMESAHHSRMLNAKDELDNKNQIGNELHQQIENDVAARREHDHNIQIKKNEVVDLENKLNVFPSKMESLKQQRDDLLQNLKIQEDKLAQRNQEHQTMINNLTIGLQLYRSLGMDFKKSPDQSLSMVFTLIDKHDPAREFRISLRLSDIEKVYVVTAVKPALDVVTLSQMVDDLNSAYDHQDSTGFPRFVTKVRRMFKELVEQ
mmetsp:Transcript_40866/g.52672  ORF Transcript_40866/g.52672 Transcript_40866/m.52672 type:complete len:252 (+) Transcript_40866:31-786(+)